MKYKVGNCVRIKSLDWYNENKDANGDVLCFYGVHRFTKEMSKFCNKTVTISVNLTGDGEYFIKEDDETNWWTDDMIEELVEEEETYDFLKTDKPYPSKPRLVDFLDMLDNEINLPEGYEFRDENGNIINVKKVVLEKKKQ